MGKDKTDQTCEGQPRAFLNRFLNQNFAESLAPVGLIDVDADLCCTVIGRSTIERLKAQPRGDLITDPQYPQRSAIWSVFMEPEKSALYRDRI
ncbi:hypothetical protein D3C81_2023820 [compost metagenome]